MRTKREARAQVLSPEDHETCTVIGTGSAAGDTTPPWLIFKPFPSFGWAYLDGDANMRFAQSASLLSNGDITDEWARHFNRQSWEKSSTAKSRGQSFGEWFSCDEHLRDPLQPHISFDIPPASRKEEEIIWRLLVINAFAGHGAFAFREYCIKFNILVAFLPAHSTHFLQLMHVGVFQSMKNAHQKKLREELRNGSPSFCRIDFARAFQATPKSSLLCDYVLTRA
jgi:hypothetical protein